MTTEVLPSPRSSSVLVVCIPLAVHQGLEAAAGPKVRQ